MTAIKWLVSSNFATYFPDHIFPGRSYTLHTTRHNNPKWIIIWKLPPSLRCLNIIVKICANFKKSRVLFQCVGRSLARGRDVVQDTRLPLHCDQRGGIYPPHFHCSWRLCSHPLSLPLPVRNLNRAQYIFSIITNTLIMRSFFLLRLEIYQPYLQ